MPGRNDAKMGAANSLDALEYNTASIKKKFDLIILQFIQSLQTIVPQSGCALTFEQKKEKK